MAQRADIRYVQFYTAGSAARKLEVAAPQKTVKKPRALKQKKIVIRIDPLATLGTLTALVLLVLMVVGMFQVQDARQKSAAMAQYVETLKTENTLLQNTYDNGYDLEQVEKTALALGMVPAEQVEQIPIRVSVPQQTQETPGFWESITAFLAGLFA